MVFNGKQIPVLISLVSEDDDQLFIIKKPNQLDITSINESVDELWSEYFAYILKNKFKYIFLHNLGSFDGYFNYKYLSNFFEPTTISTIIDHHNKFIKINLKLNNVDIIWLDSMRIFPVKLDKLCEVFGVEGKISKYNKLFNSFDLFNDDKLFNEFKKYSLQDSLCLYQALVEAQKLYISQYNVDITSILSTSTLSLKIFRPNFQDVDISILKGSEDNFIRKSYFGGHTDYYKPYITNCYYYDINSLYPKAMCEPMPHKIIKYHNDLSNIKLNEFFGYCLAEITTPKNILKPLLPYKHNGKTIFPTGTWIGVYFSEELLAVQKYGYQITLISGYEYSQIYLFNKYVDHFYNKKKKSTGASRFIAKMHLNQLYGIFGRKQDIIETINIYKHELPKYLTTKIIKSVIEINDDIVALLIQNNINYDIIKDLNIYLETDISNNYSQVKSNVAIAAAVTSYARIHMLPYINSEGVVYTDTDSIFTTKKLDDNLIGKELGLMKDELNDNHIGGDEAYNIIDEAYFLGIKQYGYSYIENNDMDHYNQYIYNSVFAGITRNTITFDEIESIFNGDTIIKYIPTRFYKSFKDLSITIKSTKISIKSKTKTNEKQFISI